MANLTLTIDDGVLERARIRALEEDKSVNALVREFLESYADERAAREDERVAREKREAAFQDLRRIARESKASSGGWKWNRDEIYEERTRWPRS